MTGGKSTFRVIEIVVGARSRWYGGMMNGLNRYGLILGLVVAVTTSVSCSTGVAAGDQPAAATSQLSAAQKAKVGQRIWQNECAGTVDGLTTWNVGEDFISLGIGHAIWFPKNANERFTETFPMLMRYMRDRGVKFPAWLAPGQPCPWNSRTEFQRDFRSPRANELRAFLKATIPQQTDFIIARQQAAKGKILAAAPGNQRNVINARWNALTATPEGTFALIDYSNFKGEGVALDERYRGEGWGLLQVLQGMREIPQGRAAAAEFAESAKRVLARRVQLSPPDRGESRWTAGWNNRMDRYKLPL